MKTGEEKLPRQGNNCVLLLKAFPTTSNMSHDFCIRPLAIPENSIHPELFVEKIK